MSRAQPGRGPSGPRRAGRSEGTTRTGRAVLVVVVVVAIAVVVLSRTPTTARVTAVPTTLRAPTTTVAPSVTTTTLAATIPPSQIRLQVLNGVLTGSISAQFTAQLKSNPGYETLPPDNATAAVTSSTIYILTGGYLPEAEVLARTVGLPNSAIVQTVPPPSSAPIPSAVLTQANLVLVVGPDLASRA